MGELEDYKIAGTKPSYISKFKLYNWGIYVHRPVDEMGVKSPEKGWQFSIARVPLTILFPENDTKASALVEFKKKAKLLGNQREFDHEVELTMDANSEIFRRA